MRFVVTGAAGMLGSTFIEMLGDRAFPVYRESLDVRDPQRIAMLFEQHRPDVLINCAADVDAETAEIDPDRAIIANSILPELLAAACRRGNALMVQFSSTGCYGDWKAGGAAFIEEDAVRPTTVHHASKVSGERSVRASGAEHLILRTGWLFGGGPEHKKNFVWKRIVEAAGMSSMRSDNHQRGNPTFVRDVVMQTLLLVEQRTRGTFNCVGREATTRLGYVQAIVDLADFPCVLEPSEPFQRLAPVSSNETALNYRLGLMGLDRMPRWRESLATYLLEVRNFPAWRELKADPAS